MTSTLLAAPPMGATLGPVEITSPFPGVRAVDYRGRDAWLEARRSMIGASDTASIFGVGYADQSPITVWESKVYPPREEDRSKLDKRLRIGKRMEPALRGIFEDETDLPCEDPGEFRIYRHEELVWLGATLDGFTVHDEYGWCPVELKNVSNFNRAEWDGDEPPLKFQVQVQHQLAVTGASHGFLLGLIGGNEPIVKVIERNESFIAAMIARLKEFWGYVERRELPPVDASEATKAALGRLWPESTGETVALPAESLNVCREIDEAKSQEKAAGERRTLNENKLKAMIGEATYGETPAGDRYSWKEQTRAAHVVKESTFRVLRKLSK